MMKREKQTSLRRAICCLAMAGVLGMSACSAGGGAMAGPITDTGEAAQAGPSPAAKTPLPPDAAPPSPTGAESSPAPIVAEDDIPDLSVTYTDGKDPLPIPSCSGGYTVLVPQPDGTTASVIACGAEPFSALMESDTDIPYLETGSVITLTFRDGLRPDSITMTDLLLREDGSALYNERSSAVTELEPEGDTLSFSLKKNISACLSSTIQPDGFYRGFRLVCSWDCGSEAEYAFIIRSDAIPGPDEKTAP